MKQIKTKEEFKKEFSEVVHLTDDTIIEALIIASQSARRKRK